MLLESLALLERMPKSEGLTFPLAFQGYKHKQKLFTLTPSREILTLTKALNVAEQFNRWHFK